MKNNEWKKELKPRKGKQRKGFKANIGLTKVTSKAARQAQKIWEFSDYVLKISGKREIAKYEGFTHQNNSKVNKQQFTMNE